MSVIKKPSELEAKKNISILIYGEPGIGKTTMGCSAPNAVLFDYDGGVNRVNGAHQIPTVQVKSWNDTIEAMNELQGMNCQTIVIDTVGKMLDFMTQAIIASDSRLGQRDGSLTLKGYGVRKAWFINFIKQLSIMNKNVVFIAHEREDRRGDDTVKRPEIGGSSANDLIKEIDLVGYMHAIGKERTISFDPCETYYAKNTCNLPEVIKIPTLIDKDDNIVEQNNFLSRIIKSYMKNAEEKTNKNAEYADLIDIIKEKVEQVKDKESTETVARELDNMVQIYDSKIKAKAMLARKMKQLNLQ